MNVGVMETVETAGVDFAIRSLTAIGGTSGRVPFVSPVKYFQLTNPIGGELKLEASE
ncbi:hypothetical protein [Microvirga yunnanensis]|uniref:hypothetical protein n=1 Tax=Microvirga yunnanensis TaxID=2953740 RepID=UPI0021C77AC0|nr:hypothetical protein [Microvirga sp. HBU65207]